MNPPRQLQGRLKSLILESTQEQWHFDVTGITGVTDAQPTGEAHAPPERDIGPSACPPPRDAEPLKIKTKLQAKTVKQAVPKRVHDSVVTESGDDDDFMDPPTRRPVIKKQCIQVSVANASRNRTDQNTVQPPVAPTGKADKDVVKHAHAPTARCAPSIFNSFVDHLSMIQRSRIINMGFGSLLRVSAERLESRDLLKFLMDRLDPINMVINVGKENGIHVTPFAVKQVFCLPDRGDDLPLPTKDQASKALIEFKSGLGLEDARDVNASQIITILKTHNQLKSGMIDDDMAIRFFFIIACNKLLFPSTDNNIRGKDVYMTRELSSLPGMNWCKAVVDDLRDAAFNWQHDRAKEGTKSIPGCALLLIIVYLDNLRCIHQIDHKDTPRAQYFDKSVIKRIITADRIKDQQGKATFGRLPLRNITNTCYHSSKHSFTNAPTAEEHLPPTFYPSIRGELGGLVSQLVSRPRKRQSMEALAMFDVKSEKALGHINKGTLMLRAAQEEVISTLRRILEDELHGNNSKEHHGKPASRCNVSKARVNAKQADYPVTEDVDNGDRMLPTDAIHVPVVQENSEPQMLHPVPTEHMLHPVPTEHTSSEMYQDVGLPDQHSGEGEPAGCADGLHCTDIVDCTQQEHTDVTIGPVVPPVELGGHAEITSPIGSNHNNTDEPISRLDSLIDEIEASTIQEQTPALYAASKHFTMHSVIDDGVAHPFTSNCAIPDITPLQTLSTSQNDEPKLDQSTMDDELGPVLFRPCTQDEALHRATMAPRPQRLTKRPAKYVSPFKGDLQRPKIPISKAQAVRKKFHHDLKCLSDFFISNGWRVFDGTEILGSFGDKKMVSSKFMSYFIACMSYDEAIHMPDGGGYRVFLSQELGEYINIDDHEVHTQWEADLSLRVLKQDIANVDPTKVKLYFLPILEDNHFSVYCINFIHNRIDILDCTTEDHTIYHEVLGDRIIPRLNDLFQEATNGALKKFTRFKRPMIHVPKQLNENDSGIFAMKFMELWDGQTLHTPITREKVNHYRSEVLFYMIYHTLNTIKKLPAGLEAHRPRC